MRRVQSDASDAPLRCFRGMIFSVADDWMSDRRKLHPDLILQSRRQRNPDERCGPKSTFDNKPKLRASRLRVPLRAQLLKHSFASQVVNQPSIFGGEMSTHDSEILPHRCVSDELFH